MWRRGATKALCEAGCTVTLLDGLPDPTGQTPFLVAPSPDTTSGREGQGREGGEDAAHSEHNYVHMGRVLF